VSDANAILLLSCPDKKGIVAGVSNFIFKNGGNIVHADQHTSVGSKTFFMRIEWELNGFRIPRREIGAAIAPLANRFGMKWDLRFTDEVPRVALFVSRHVHCFHDLIMRNRMGEFRAEIALVISNHLDLKPLARQFGLKFMHFPITPANKARQEEREIRELERHRIDLVVLARYMQVLSNTFVEAWRNRAINIHHSFLPSFKGARPYAQAHARGVKLIGATAHYVTPDLDEGPIIEQDVARVTHSDSVAEFVAQGQDV